MCLRCAHHSLDAGQGERGVSHDFTFGEIWSHGESRLINSKETLLGSIAPRFRLFHTSLTGPLWNQTPRSWKNGTFSSTLPRLLPTFEEPKKRRHNSRRAIHVGCCLFLALPCNFPWGRPKKGTRVLQCHRSHRRVPWPRCRYLDTRGTVDRLASKESGPLGPTGGLPLHRSLLLAGAPFRWRETNPLLRQKRLSHTASAHPPTLIFRGTWLWQPVWMTRSLMVE